MQAAFHQRARLAAAGARNDEHIAARHDSLFLCLI
jgi:hypothetical protein